MDRIDSARADAGKILKAFAAFLLVCALLPWGAHAAESEDVEIALSLSNMLRAARGVIASKQPLINDPDVGDKGLSGEAVLAEAIKTYRELTQSDPRSVDADTRKGRLLLAQMTAIREVMDNSQGDINAPGIGFKGFVPAVFARLVNERFAELVGFEAEIKVTAPPSLIRNRKSRPDEWEAEVIKSRLGAQDWPNGQMFHAESTKDGREAFRVAVPEYYSEGCLSCHGEPKGEIDVTGYPKEGGKEGDLGGVISITLYR
ncbi:MAG TPA: DUF3365 domain-containing protein [Gammaproteobacteria bacterium]|nr:DUF3365 domain-containing protein [Gammaproteobacteria bacterium]